jgi:hypothetical protein
MILVIGLGVEFSNFQSMFFRFMSQYRPDWGAFNHIPAMALSAFLLLCIVIFGIRRQVALSWFLAGLTCVISFAVYSRMNLSWNWEQMTEIHFVILILSGMLPLLVAYTTHQITHDNEEDVEDMDEVMTHLRKNLRNQRKRQLLQQHAPANDDTFVNQRQQRQPYAQQQQPYQQQTPYYQQQTPPPYYQAQTPPTYQQQPYREPQPQQFYQEPPQQQPPQNKRPTTVMQMDKQKRGSFEIPRQVVEELNRERVVYAERNFNTIVPEKTRTPEPKPKPQAEVKPIAKPTDHEVFEPGKELVMDLGNKKAPAKEETEGGHLITCARCGKEAMKKSSRAKYCSEECRLNKAKKFVEADNADDNGFIKVRDDYDNSGVMEWVNVS